jgi:hypothetical protein
MYSIIITYLDILVEGIIGGPINLFIITGSLPVCLI